MVSLALCEEKADETEVKRRFLLRLDVTKALMLGFLCTPALDSLVMEDFHLRSSGTIELHSMMLGYNRL
jgi:hypothetical protein